MFLIDLRLTLFMLKAISEICSLDAFSDIPNVTDNRRRKTNNVG